MGKETVRVLQLKNRRALMRDQRLSINQELVLLRLATKNRMVLKNQRLQPRAGLPLKKQCGRQPANSPANNNAVVGLASIKDVLRQGVVYAVTGKVFPLERLYSPTPP